MDLFVYGTLMSHGLMASVSGTDLPEPVPAVLHDYTVFAAEGDVVPGIAQVAGGQALGLIWSDLPQAAIARLDAYEGAFGYVLHPVNVVVDGVSRAAHAYLPPAEQSATTTRWSLAAWEQDHLAPALLAAEELLALEPMPEPARLRAMWPMIEARAWSRHRAQAGPATIRHKAVAADMTQVAVGASAGAFFRFQGFDISHARFDGTRSPVLRREAFIGVDAAMLLPYDPARDRVLLLEQARVGPLLRHDPNPWMLEAIAGIVDAREDPAAAALREAREEAGLAIRTLVPAGAYYASPGATTDYFYTYVGLCDLAGDAPYLGGLDVEGEDLRLHPMDFDAALGLADSGEIATGPLLTLLYWLARHRDRLRAMG
jgi:ADP-ribose pyrophosphatase